MQGCWSWGLFGYKKEGDIFYLEIKVTYVLGYHIAELALMCYFF